MTERWSQEKAQAWYDAQPWIVGCNFIPSTAVNQLEMWQEDTFDPDTIDRELGLAAGLGMNAVRVYLHDLAWSAGPSGFKGRIDAFLGIAASHGIRTVFVIFDDCWHPDPEAGPQPPPRPGVHNSRWLQSPGIMAAQDTAAHGRLEAYVRDIVGTFGKDGRVLMWDVYNELGNAFLPTLAQPFFQRLPRLMVKVARHLLMPAPTLGLFRKAVQWTREAAPEQPVTAGVWFINGRLNHELIAASDIVTFHNYKNAGNLTRQIGALRKHGRPLICTEYLARSAGSLFESCMPVFREERVGCFNWGLVSGKTQTVYSWADRGGSAEPALWYHDIFRANGEPFSHEEADFIRRMTARKE